MTSSSTATSSLAIAVALVGTLTQGGCSLLFGGSPEDPDAAVPFDAVPPDARPEAPSVGLTGHWALDDGAGLLAMDSIGEIPLTLNNNSTSVEPASYWVAEGRIGGALQFIRDGTFASLPADVRFQIKLNTAKTIAVWFKAANPPLAQSAPILWSESGCLGWAIELTPDGSVVLEVKTGTGCDDSVGTSIVTSNGNFADDNWHHVVAVVDRFEGVSQMELYLDGATNESINITGLGLNNQYSQLRLAANYNETRLLACEIDEVRVYGRPLTADEVSDLYNSAP